MGGLYTFIDRRDLIHEVQQWGRTFIYTCTALGNLHMHCIVWLTFGWDFWLSVPGGSYSFSQAQECEGVSDGVTYLVKCQTFYLNSCSAVYTYWRIRTFKQRLLFCLLRAGRLEPARVSAYWKSCYWMYDKKLFGINALVVDKSTPRFGSRGPQHTSQHQIKDRVPVLQNFLNCLYLIFAFINILYWSESFTNERLSI